MMHFVSHYLWFLDWTGIQLTRTSALAECLVLFGANVCMFSALFLHTLKIGKGK